MVRDIMALVKHKAENDGIDLSKVGVGMSLRFVTADGTIYTITSIGNKLWRVRNSNLTTCTAKIHGSTWGGSSLAVDYLGVGMQLEMIPQNGPEKGKYVHTAEIKELIFPGVSNANASS